MNDYTGRRVTGASQYSEALKVIEGHALATSVVDLGSWSGTIVVQRRFHYESDTDWRTFKTISAAGEDTVDFVPVNCEIRIGCSAFTAGVALAEVRVSKIPKT